MRACVALAVAARECARSARGMEVTQEMNRGLRSRVNASRNGAPPPSRQHVREAPFKRDLNLASKFQPLQLFPQLFPASQAGTQIHEIDCGPFL